jgi:hypothetical protein
MIKFYFVPGCTTGYAKDIKENKTSGLKNKSIFKAHNVRKQKLLILFMNISLLNIFTYFV